MNLRREPNRKPAAFKPDRIELVETPLPSELPLGVAGTPATLPARVPNLPRLRRGFAWGGLLLSSLGALVALIAGIGLQNFVIDLLSRGDWLGWLALIFAALAALAALAIVLREALGLFRIQKLGQLRADAEGALKEADKKAAESVASGVASLYASREDVAWGKAQLAEHETGFMDAMEVLKLAERHLVAPLDAPARSIVAASAKRVSVVTAVSPVAIIDMSFVAAENLRMLRRLATLYGARPGMLGLFRLVRMVVGHIVLTGGIAMGDDLIHQVIGHGMTARLSAKLGEGVFNGALTARIGLATIDVCRPLPYIEATRPRFRELVAEVAGIKAA